MPNEKKHDSGASEGARRATEDAPEWSCAGGGRWSAKRTVTAILELLRGADLESASRKYGVTAATLTQWRDRFLAGGELSLQHRQADVDDEEKRGSSRQWPTSASITSCCARRLRSWRTAALWRSGSRNPEPHRFAFQQPAVWCGAGGRGLGSGAIQLLCCSAAPAAAEGAWKTRPQSA